MNKKHTHTSPTLSSFNYETACRQIYQSTKFLMCYFFIYSFLQIFYVIYQAVNGRSKHSDDIDEHFSWRQFNFSMISMWSLPAWAAIPRVLWNGSPLLMRGPSRVIDHGVQTSHHCCQIETGYFGETSLYISKYLIQRFINPALINLQYLTQQNNHKWLLMAIFHGSAWYHFTLHVLSRISVAQLTSSPPGNK